MGRTWTHPDGGWSRGGRGRYTRPACRTGRRRRWRNRGRPPPERRSRAWVATRAVTGVRARRRVTAHPPPSLPGGQGCDRGDSRRPPVAEIGPLAPWSPSSLLRTVLVPRTRRDDLLGKRSTTSADRLAAAERFDPSHVHALVKGRGIPTSRRRRRCTAASPARHPASWKRSGDPRARLRRTRRRRGPLPRRSEPVQTSSM